jgi:hypothetical protein
MEDKIINQENEVLLTDYSPQGLISQALAQNVPVETLERIMNLAEHWNAEQSRKQFISAMNEFQSIVPTLKKKKKVSFNQTKYNYTPLADIVSGIQSSMQKTGLSHRWELEEKEDNIICTCIISHIGGHSEKTTMSAKKDSSGNKNDIQSRGSAVTYLQRYTLIGALGISTADEDNDGKTSEPQKPKEEIPEPQEKINWGNLIKNSESIKELNAVWKRMSEKEQEEHREIFNKIRLNIKDATKKETK